MKTKEIETQTAVNNAVTEIGKMEGVDRELAFNNLGYWVMNCQEVANVPK